MSDDMRDMFEPQTSGGGVRLYPYTKNVYYHPSGVLSMTIQIYDDIETQEFSFGINVNGNLKAFLDQLYEPGDIL